MLPPQVQHQRWVDGLGRGSAPGYSRPRAVPGRRARGTFGVPGTLADPQLAVFKQGVATALQQNDNWSTGTNSAELVATAARVGSFVLPAGSRDAVLLVVLEPGAYTVQVSGVGATTGVALLEIYDAP